MPSDSEYAIFLCSSATGLAVVHSLARAGVSSIIICPSADEPAMFSRYPHRKHVLSTDKPFDDAMLEVLSRYADKGYVLLATSDKFMSFVNRHRQTLEKGFLTCMPDIGITETLLDKQQETQLIERAGIPLPKTVQHLPETPAELEAVLGLPILIKPRLAELAKDLDNRKNLLIDSKAALDDFYQRFHLVFDSLLAQQVIQDADNSWGCNCTFDFEHNLSMVCTYRRMRMSPAHYGVTSYAISEYNPAIVAYAEALGKYLKYTGNAGIEFKQDPRDGQYKYIELNPRLPMTNYFHTCTGINNVHAAYRLAKGMVSLGQKPLQKDGVIFLALHDDFYARLKDHEPLSSILLEDSDVIPKNADTYI
ncbi:MAG: hypothetical protein AAF512_23335, partial [Pseudomonadota bacterium]